MKKPAEILDETNGPQPQDSTFKFEKPAPTDEHGWRQILKESDFDALA